MAELTTEGDGPIKKAGRFRTALPQWLASSAKNMILLDLGMTVAFPTIVIGALHNTADPLALNDEQTSWFGSIAYICQPVGSVLSGIILEKLGRKRSMLLVNIPHLIGWLMFYFSNSIPMLFSCNVIMGLGVGFMEAPIITYVGEISQPHLRGILTSYAGIFVQLGFLIEYAIGIRGNWRLAAIYSAIVPVLTVAVISQVPETPQWLLARNRVKDAEKSLCWLRGWVPPSAVKEELDDMKRYAEELKRTKDAEKLEGANTCMRKAGYLIEPQTLRPLVIVIMFFFFQHWSGFSGMRPYMIGVFAEYGVQVEGHLMTLITGVIGIVGNVTCMFVVQFTGKRPISLVCMAASCVSCFLLAFYAYIVLDPGVNTAHLSETISWLPIVTFIVLVFAQNAGVLPIPWMVLSEVFPFKSRGLASGIAAAVCYVLAFMASKSFLWLKTNLHLEGVYLLYGILGFLGFVVIYFFFSETEGRTLEDIEEFYKYGFTGKIHKSADNKNSVNGIALSLCSTNDLAVMEKGHTNTAFSEIEDDRMINNALYEGDADRKIPDKSDDHLNGTRVDTKDTTFTEPSGISKSFRCPNKRAAPQIPQKTRRKSTDNLNGGSTEHKNEISTGKVENVEAENNSEYKKEDETISITNDNTNGNEDNESLKGNTKRVNSFQEKVIVHSDAEVESKTKM